MIHVSIHDVSPRWSYEVETALAWCHAIGARPALLVVPDMHYKHPIARDAAFCQRVRQLAREGHEVYLHGYFHLSKPGEGLGNFLAQKVASAGEAEFAALDQPEGEALLDRGLTEFKSLEIPVDGFVPPAWARRAWMLPALKARGIAYSEDQLFAYDPTTGARRLAPALNYASRTRGRRLSSVGYARAARLYPLAGMHVRVAIHPADLGYSMLVRETKSLLDWARGGTTDRASDLFR